MKIIIPLFSLVVINFTVMVLLAFFVILLTSSSMYLFLHFKTKMNKRLMYIDNLIVIILSSILFLIAYLYVFKSFQNIGWFLSIIVGQMLVLMIGFALTMIRFWRTPKRKINQDSDYIVSPADGNIIYLKKLHGNTIPIAVKGGKLSKLEELTKTSILNDSFWLIGINMTPFDVHKNCAPISGKILLNQHTPGKFLSLKHFDSETDNERNTLVIQNEAIQVGVVQIASKLVRRIDSYVETGDNIQKGQWFGMIRFGSQVDIILPKIVELKISVGEQVYAGETIIGLIR